MPSELGLPSEAANTPTTDLFVSSLHSRQPSSPFQSKSRSQSPASPIVSLECPPGLTYLEWVKQWSDAHVARWLAEAKVPQYAPRFREHDIRGDVILDLDQCALKDTGIASVGDRIKIIVAIKALRQKCMRAQVPASPLSHPRVITDLRAKDPKDGNVSKQNGRRLETGRPPPLHISNPSKHSFPQLIQSAHGIPSLNITSIPRYTSPSSGSSAAQTSSQPPPQYSTRANLPPQMPVPRSQPPPPPRQPSRNGLNSTGASQPGKKVTDPHPPPPYTRGELPPAPTPSSSTPRSPGDPAPPARPNPGNLQGGAFPKLTDQRGPPFPRSNSPVPPINIRSSSTRPLHQKAGSTSLVSSPLGPSTRAGASRPGTSPVVPVPQSHPYGNPITLPSLHVPTMANGPTLSPISERNIQDDSKDFVNGHSLGRGSSNRPNTPSSSAPNPPIPLAELKRRCVKFILADDGHSRVVDVDDCETGVDVIERALRKMNKSTGGRPVVTHTENGGLVVDGWSISSEGPGGTPSRQPLSEAELLAICHTDVSNPSREHGLTLRRYIFPRKNVNKLEHFFGELPPSKSTQIPPSSPPKLSNIPTPRPTLAIPDSDEPAPRTNLRSLSPSETITNSMSQSAANKKLARASTVSVMSGLGILPPDINTSPSKQSPSSSLRPSPQQNKLRRFFGARPPSELITSHLGEFFPNAEKRVLDRTVRNSSILRASLSMKRDSVRSSWNSSIYPGVHSRRSTSPSRSLLNDSPRPSLSRRRPPGASRLSESEDSVIPRVSISTDGGQSQAVSSDADDDSISRTSASIAEEPPTPHVLPPVQFGTESLSDSLLPTLNQNNFLRASTAKSRRSSKRLSTMTVDEITAEVQNRELGVISDGEEEGDQTVIDEKEQKDVDAQEEEEEGEEEYEEEEEGDMNTDELGELEEEEEEEEDEEDEVGKAVTSRGGKGSIKWVKGALIGSGSFGSVYLAMDARQGLLMAVKQVELPTGSSANEERKKDMLSALEREIELLKELQHPNIVQYLDSSMDDKYLNIFLEYVPGGSVVTLLRNYGAFEEALVRNWVKQILTGLGYLHGRDIIHRDIKGANILVDNKGGIKISDFGISKKVEDNLLSSARVHRPSLQGSVFWMAPEVVKQTSYTSKADIWSVGCLIVEMLTGDHPWANLNQFQAIFRIGAMAKPETPSDISPEAEDFLKKTFEFDEKLRPSAAELLQHPFAHE